MVITPLDSTVAQVVHAARLLEKAVHEYGTWTISWGPQTLPAKRTLTDCGAIFSVIFPDACHLEKFDAPLVLSKDGEPIAVKPITWPGDGSFAVDWEIRGRLTTVSA